MRGDAARVLDTVATAVEQLDAHAVVAGQAWLDASTDTCPAVRLVERDARAFGARVRLAGRLEAGHERCSEQYEDCETHFGSHCAREPARGCIAAGASEARTHPEQVERAEAGEHCNQAELHEEREAIRGVQRRRTANLQPRCEQSGQEECAESEGSGDRELPSEGSEGDASLVAAQLPRDKEKRRQ
jgi:hypothetical protein